MHNDTYVKLNGTAWKAGTDTITFISDAQFRRDNGANSTVHTYTHSGYTVTVSMGATYPADFYNGNFGVGAGIATMKINGTTYHLQ